MWIGALCALVSDLPLLPLLPALDGTAFPPFITPRPECSREIYRLSMRLAQPIRANLIPTALPL